MKDDPAHLKRFTGKNKALTDFTRLDMPSHHKLEKKDLTEKSIQQLEKAYEIQPDNFKQLVNIEGVGKKSLRSLALIAELVYGSENSWEDPAKYAYTHGGKDGTPFPVDRQLYDENIRKMEQMLEGSNIEKREKKKAFKRLQKFIN